MRTAASRCGGRSYSPGTRLRGKPRRRGAAARGVARTGGRRPNSRGGAEPARLVGPHGHDPVRPRTAVFTLADHAPVARDLVHADRVGRGAVCASDRPPLVSTFGIGVGAHGRNHVGTVCRGASRGGNQAGVSRYPGPREEAGVNPQARAGARVGPISRWRCPDRTCPDRMMSVNSRPEGRRLAVIQASVSFKPSSAIFDLFAALARTLRNIVAIAWSALRQIAAWATMTPPSPV